MAKKIHVYLLKNDNLIKNVSHSISYGREGVFSFILVTSYVGMIRCCDDYEKYVVNYRSALGTRVRVVS